MRIVRAAALLSVMVLVAAACGDDDEAVPPGDTTTTTVPDTTTTAPAETTTTALADTTTTTVPDGDDTVAVSVYFIDADEWLKVGWARAVQPPTVATGALEALLEGPTVDEAALGMTTAVPQGTRLLGAVLEDGVAAVDLSGEFASGGGSLSMNARLAQVVFTATQFPTVDAVRLHLDGRPADTLGGEGLVVDRPLTRADFEFGGEFEHLAAPILVETPRPGERIDGDRLWVAGSSNTFEAALYFELTAADGTVLVEETFVMATAGTGTRGTFDATLPLPSGAAGPATLLGYELSARDGSRVNITEIPLELSG